MLTSSWKTQATLHGGRLFRQFTRSSPSSSEEEEEVKTTGPAFEPADDDVFQLLASCSSSEEEDRVMTPGLEPTDDYLFLPVASCSSSEEEDRMMTSGLEPAPDISRGKVGAMNGDRKRKGTELLSGVRRERYRQQRQDEVESRTRQARRTRSDGKDLARNQHY
jgi:hypothetical protein